MSRSFYGNSPLTVWLLTTKHFFVWNTLKTMRNMQDLQ